MDEDSIQQLYSWIDEIVLSRPKRNITRDFSDGVLAAEICAHFVPDIVELHNYTPANNSQQKRVNWETLNRKVFKRLDFHVPGNIVNGIIMCKPGVIEIVLHNLRVKVLNYKKTKDTESESDYNELNSDVEHWNSASYYQNIPQQYPGGVLQYPSIQSIPQPVFHNPLSHQQQQQPSRIPQPNAMLPQHYPQRPAENLPANNGGLATIPFEGEKVRKKKSPKKKKNPSSVPSPAKIGGSERSRSMPSNLTHLDHESRIYIQEKEQQLLQSQETIQILQSKISRLEHLLQLKDLRIEDLDMKLKSTLGGGRPMR